jgi:hypothetical protein
VVEAVLGEEENNGHRDAGTLSRLKTRFALPRQNNRDAGTLSRLKTRFALPRQNMPM